MGLLDEILRQIEEAQQQAEGRRQRPQAPERETDADGAEWEEDEAARPGHAPHIPPRAAAVAAAPPPAPEPPPVRTTADSAPAAAPHARGVPPAVRIRAMLAGPASIRDALVAREILGPPPGLRRRPAPTGPGPRRP